MKIFFDNNPVGCYQNWASPPKGGGATKKKEWIDRVAFLLLRGLTPGIKLYPPPGQVHPRPWVTLLYK